MKKVLLCALALLLAVGGPAIAEICTIDDVPAATLLLPYFEVDLDNPDGPTTLFSINNASAAATVAHVTLWTDLSEPVLDFDVYLTGYDVQTINMRDIVNGDLPVTADDKADGADTISPQGNAVPPNNSGLENPQDVDILPDSSGPCVAEAYPAGLSSSFVNDHLQPALTGGSSSIDGIVGLDYGDNVARGYVTVDQAVRCSLDFPSAPGYFTDIAGFDNILWGDYFYVDGGNNFAQGETLVHIEACSLDTAEQDSSVGVWSDTFDCGFDSADFTFYDRYGTNSADQREPLASQWATRYLTSATLFDGGTDLVIWRDSRQDIGTHPLWFPLGQEIVVAFDEEEQSEELCVTTRTDVSPPETEVGNCFPAEAARYNVEDSIVPGSDTLAPTAPFGWMFLDLDVCYPDGSGLIPECGPGNTEFADSQAWVTPIMSALGRFSVGFDGIALDTACTGAPTIQ